LLTLDLEVSWKCFQENLGNYVRSTEQVYINKFLELLQLLLAIRHFYQQQKLEVPGEWKQLEESIQKNEEATLALAHVLETYKKACRMQEFSPIKSFANC
jgi:hypothetical protein